MDNNNPRIHHQIRALGINYQIPDRTMVGQIALLKKSIRRAMNEAPMR
jgi:hypothetical protein